MMNEKSIYVWIRRNGGSDKYSLHFSNQISITQFNTRDRVFKISYSNDCQYLTISLNNKNKDEILYCEGKIQVYGWCIDLKKDHPILVHGTDSLQNFKSIEFLKEYGKGLCPICSKIKTIMDYNPGKPVKMKIIKLFSRKVKKELCSYHWNKFRDKYHCMKCGIPGYNSIKENANSSCCRNCYYWECCPHCDKYNIRTYKLPTKKQEVTNSDFPISQSCGIFQLTIIGTSDIFL